jgi:D-alanyl-D-alanine carboxypeptidase
LAAFSRILALCLTLVFLAGAGPAPAQGPSLLFDPATGEVISQDRAGEPWYPASLTKLMTSYIVFNKLREGRLTLEQKVPVSALAASMPPSKIGMKAGSAVSVDFALQALLVYSANDMAYVLAEAAGGTRDAFVAEMNATAHKLGMTGTHFVNPNGLFEPRQITTARDLGLLVTAILREFPDRAHYFSQPFVTVGKRHLANRNSLIRQMPEADGMKTGFVCNSGFNLVASATHDGRKLVAVIFGARSGKARADLAQMLLVDGFSRPPEARRLQLASLADDQVGGIVPADMTATVCKQKAPITVADAHDLTGWGISFGQYESAQKADMALRGRLLDAAGADAGGTAGIIEMPGQKTYSAMLWNIGQQTSMALCAQYRSRNAYCDVMTPDTFAQIAALTPTPAPASARPVAEGSDDAKPKAKKKKNP